MSGCPVAIVVPCFNEAARLDGPALVELAELADARLVLVDDGSTDATPAILAKLVAEWPERFEVLELATNVGKGEAVRRGMQAALGCGAELVGYFDADMATPAAEMARLVTTLRERPDLAVVLGARVALLGHRVRRSPVRHYVGRLFATASSLVLHLDVYDTQCGAKVFRDSPALHSALGRPFASRWLFDVELLGRLHQGPVRGQGIHREAFLEVPLDEWCDMGGSKVGVGVACSAAVDLARIARALRRWPR